MESPETDLRIYSHLIYKKAPLQLNGGKMVFQTNSAMASEHLPGVGKRVNKATRRKHRRISFE